MNDKNNGQGITENPLNPKYGAIKKIYKLIFILT